MESEINLLAKGTCFLWGKTKVTQEWEQVPEIQKLVRVAKAEDLWVQSQPGLRGETVPDNNKPMQHN